MTNIRLKCALFAIMVISGTISCRNQIFVTDPETKVALGTLDAIEGVDNRVVSYNKSETVTSKNDAVFSPRLGLSQWGLIQASLYLEKREGIDSPLRSSFCRINEKVATLTLKSSYDFGNSSKIYDYEVNRNKLYIIDTYANLYVFEIRPFEDQSINQSSSQLNLIWARKGLEEFSIQEKKMSFSTAGLAVYEKEELLYVPTSAGLLVVDLKTQQPSFVAKGVFDARIGIVFTDIIEGYLFVAYQIGGIFVYNVKNKDQISFVGNMDSSFFQISDIDSFSISMFLLHDYTIEISSKQDADLSSNILGDSFFKGNFTHQQRIDNIVKRTNSTSRIMFVAEASGVFAVDLESLLTFGKMPKRPLARKIPIEDVYRLARYKDTLYMVKSTVQSPNDKTEQRALLFEVFLSAEDPKRWDMPEDKKNPIYDINRAMPFSTDIQNVYVDDKNIFIIGAMNVFVYERGIPKSFELESIRISKLNYDPFIFGFHKFIIDGNDFLVSFGPQRISDYSVEISDPEISCPGYDISKSAYGTYHFKLNVTTRDCPKKFEIQSSQTRSNLTFNVELFNNPCVWMKNFSVTYSESKFYEVGGKTNYYFVSLLAVVLLFLILAYLCYQRNKSLTKEYEKLKLEIGSIKPDEKDFYKDVEVEGTPTPPYKTGDNIGLQGQNSKRAAGFFERTDSLPENLLIKANII